MFGMGGSLAQTVHARCDSSHVTGAWLTRQLRVATLPAMFRRTPRPPAADALGPTLDDGPDPLAAETPEGIVAPSASDTSMAAMPDLSSLPIVGITRRRAAGALAAFLAAWIVIVFARQVGEASAATARADDMALANVELQSDVAALERELELIGRQRYIEQQARSHGLGRPREVAFALDPAAPSLPLDAPGSAAVRLGSEIGRVSPLERWLTVLFGPTD